MSDLSGCIFCRISNKEIPAEIIYEDANVMAFLDINPRFKGHALVIPRMHFEKLDELSDEIISHLFMVVKRVAKTLVNELGAKGYNILSNNGKVAGQVVPHVHIHIIPRYEEKHAGIGIEAAIPVDEEAKGKIKEVANAVRGKIPSPEKNIIDSQVQASKKEDEKNEASEEEEESYFDEDGIPRFV